MAQIKSHSKYGKNFPHYFIDHLELEDYFNAGRYEKEAIELLLKLYQNNDIVLLVGGTGLYLRAIMEGLDEFPVVHKSIKEKWQSLFDKNGLEPLQTALKEKDPAYYLQVDQQNPHRLIRALSVIEAGNKPFSHWLSQKGNNRPFQMIPILLMEERQILYDKINRRVEKMVKDGLIEEARLLYDRRHLQSLQTVGYQELFKYFDGEITREEAIDLIKMNSRRYAKRQTTWFKKYGHWTKFNVNEKEQILPFILSKIQA